MRISSQIERRLLVNYRVEPDVIASILPDGLAPQLVKGWAVAGICLFRLGHVRPYGLPGRLRLASENAAHRIAVQWQRNGELRTGVYIARRDTDSTIVQMMGGRVFPGVHRRAAFTSQERADTVRVTLRSADGEVDVDASATMTDRLVGSELFADLSEASDFFARSPTAWSPGRDGSLEAIPFGSSAWSIRPAKDPQVRSTQRW